MQELLKELEKIDDPEYLFELEDKIVKLITSIVSHEEPQEAKRKITELRGLIFNNIYYAPHIKPLLPSFHTSVEGAINAALSCI